jgi:hypothetical protein
VLLGEIGSFDVDAAPGEGAQKGVGVTIPPPRYELGVGQFFPLKMDDSHILKVYVSWGMGNDDK